jgi:mRNA interferase MazF
MVKKGYIPDTGDIVWLNFSPQAGHEQAGHRPALVLSPLVYNKASGRMLACPLTTKMKGYPFEVPLSGTGKPSVVLADQVKNLDWKARGAVFKGQAGKNEVAQVRKIVAMLVGV